MQKNPDPITKHEWYMGMALVTAKRSKDPKTQVGCAIVDDGGVVVSVGYNGMPTSCGDDVSTCPPPKCAFSAHYRCVQKAEALT